MRTVRRGWVQIQTTVAVILLAMVLAESAAAQYANRGLRRVEERTERSQVGMHLNLGVPRGNIEEFVDFAGGLDIFGVIGPVLGFRIEGSFMLYDVGTLVGDNGSVRSTSFITSFGMGPQFTIPAGGFRPYVYSTIGLSYLGTKFRDSYYGCCAGGGGFTFVDDWALALAVGGGLNLRVASGRTPVYMDLSVFYQYNYNAQLFVPVEVTESVNEVVVGVVETNPNMLVFRFGIAVGLF